MTMTKPAAPLLPSSTIGILGGGQLGRMMAIAAAELGYSVHIYCPEENSPASEVAKFTTIAKYDDIESLQKFAKSVDVVTYEFENIPFAPVASIAELVRISPSPQILATSQHRVVEKSTIQKLGVGTAPFVPVSSYAELLTAANRLGFPSVLKTATMGYDGKGQVILHNAGELEKGWETISKHSDNQQQPDAILEGFVDFKMEISVIVARNEAGDMRCYCPVQNVHRHHILAETIAPAPISESLADAACDIAQQIALGLNLVGLMAIEMFVTSDDKILVNETAPRPHNSGHWTLDACITDQFEQAIRAICGLPLGSAQRLCDARMLNLIGSDVNDAQKHLASPVAKLHIYGKKEAKTGRKMGHVTFLLNS